MTPTSFQLGLIAVGLWAVALSVGFVVRDHLAARRPEVTDRLGRHGRYEVDVRVGG